MSAKRLETFDVVADVASARARRFRGGSEARARRSRYVSRVLAGTRGRARVRGLLRTTLRPQRRLRAPSMRSTPSAPSPEARVGRWTLRGAGDAKQPLKRRESARKAGAAARETVMPVSRGRNARGAQTRADPGLVGKPLTGGRASRRTGSGYSLSSTPVVGGGRVPEEMIGRRILNGRSTLETARERVWVRRAGWWLSTACALFGRKIAIAGQKIRSSGGPAVRCAAGKVETQELQLQSAVDLLVDLWRSS